MEINRSLLKRQAKDIILNSNMRVFLAGGTYLLLSILFSVLSAKLLGVGMTETDIAQYSKYVMEGDIDSAVAYFTRIAPPASAYLIDLALNVVNRIVSVGFILFLMNTVRNMNASFGNLLDGFGFAGRIILLSILEAVFVALWSMLFIVPGIMAAYSYRMSVYIMLDHPEMSARQCLKESKRMMKGHKWELFVLDLSFIGWALLSMIPGLSYVIQIWTLPYINTTLVLYYESLKVKADYTDWG